jgi:lysophospholipase L1-like esterase
MNNIWKFLNKYFLVFSFLITIYDVSNAQSKGSYFNPNDRVCFIGNSITHAGYYHYFLNLYYATRYPELHYESYNCGISGDVAGGVLKRMQKDILVHRPTVASMMIGMNDVNRELYAAKDHSKDLEKQKSLEVYKGRIEQIYDSLSTEGCKLIFLTPSIYDQESTISPENLVGVNDALGICSQYIRDFSKKYKGTLVDFNAEMNNINRAGIKKDSNFGLAGADRVHPPLWGHFIMSYFFLKSIENPSVVSGIYINSRNASKTKISNCRVSNFDLQSGKLSFDCLENALPFPITDDIQKALSIVPFSAEYNQELLKIKHLDAGKYWLIIDQDTIYSFSEKQLSEGINLATYSKTPQFKQAMKVQQLSWERHQLISSKLRLMALFDYSDLINCNDSTSIVVIKDLLDKRVESVKGKPWYNYFKTSAEQYLETRPLKMKILQDVDRLQQEIYLANIPKTHHYQLIKNMNY